MLQFHIVFFDEISVAGEAKPKNIYILFNTHHKRQPSQFLAIVLRAMKANNLPNTLAALWSLAEVDTHLAEVLWYCLPPSSHHHSLRPLSWPLYHRLALRAAPALHTWTLPIWCQEILNAPSLHTHSSGICGELVCVRDVVQWLRGWERRGRHQEGGGGGEGASGRSRHGGDAERLQIWVRLIV